MGTASERETKLSRLLDRVSFDVAFILLAITSSYISVAVQASPLARTVLSLPLFVFLPGYALLLTLYPYNASVDNLPIPDGVPKWQRQRVGIVERAALSFGISLGIVAGVGLLLSSGGIGIEASNILESLAGITFVFLFIGEVRRQRLHESEQFHVPIRNWFEYISRSVTRTSNVDSAINVSLAIVMVLATVSVGYAIFAPSTGESYSNMTLLTQSSSGEFVASEYPSTLSTNEESELFVRVTNYEGEETSYTVVAALQRVDQSGDREVVETQVLGQRTETVADGETWQMEHAFRPELTGENLRLTYFLYKGEAPEEPSVESAYRSTYVWVTVTDE